jgi:signal transduction histidine kinase
MKLPLRARLTALFAAVFVLSAGALLALTLVLVNRSLDAAAAVNSPAQREYVNQLEKALTELQNEAGPGKPDSDTQKKQSDLKQRLIEANAGSGQAVRDSAVNNLLGTSLVTLAVLVPTAAFGSWLLVRRTLRPVTAITAAARRASEHRLDERLALSGPRDEITELAGTFNEMLARLEHAFDAQRRFVANASHELRTPLTVARTAIDVTMAKPERTDEQLAQLAADVHGAVDRAERLVDGLLTLTRSQHLVHAAEPVDLATASQDALDTLASEITAAALTVHTVLNPAPTTGDPTLLDRLVANLIENAVRHNEPSGWLSVHTGLDGTGARLEVINTGPAVDPAHVAELFEPFQRAGGRARSTEHGLGLGLSIVRAVADAHQATVTATARPGGGLIIGVTL